MISVQQNHWLIIMYWFFLWYYSPLSVRAISLWVADINFIISQAISLTVADIYVLVYFQSSNITDSCWYLCVSLLSVKQYQWELLIFMYYFIISQAISLTVADIYVSFYYQSSNITDSCWYLCIILLSVKQYHWQLLIFMYYFIISQAISLTVADIYVLFYYQSSNINESCWFLCIILLSSQAISQRVSDIRIRIWHITGFNILCFGKYTGCSSWNTGNHKTI